MTRVALDTNVLVYAEESERSTKKQTATALLTRLSPTSTFIPLQALVELFHLLVRRALVSASSARLAVAAWQDSFQVIETSESIFTAALALAVDHRLTIGDALMLAAAADAGCRLLLSEDLQDGFTWSGVTVANPFAKARHPLLVAVLS
jgi:predicted nucleic acid-binding protein